MSGLLTRAVGRITLLTTAALVALVAGVGGVALVAEFHKTWTWYRRMERVAHASVDPAVTLLSLCLVCYVGLVVVADR